MPENTREIVLNQQGRYAAIATRFLVMNELKDRVLRRRKQLDLTQEQVAKEVGVKQQSIQQLEDGLVKRPRYLLELSRVLQCDVNWLATGKGNAETIPHAPNIPPELAALMSKATPRSYRSLMRIAQAIADGRLTDDDAKLLGVIAERFEGKE